MDIIHLQDLEDRLVSLIVHQDRAKLLVATNYYRNGNFWLRLQLLVTGRGCQHLID